MDPLRIRNVSDDFALLGIHYDHVSRASDEQAMRRGIHFEVVPAARAAELHFLDQMIAGGTSGLSGRVEKCSSQQRTQEQRKTKARNFHPNQCFHKLKEPKTSR